MASTIVVDSVYQEFLSSVKLRVRNARVRSAIAANSELILAYWEVGREILDRQEREGWGSKIIDQLSSDLRSEFPDLKGFSGRNLKYMRAFAAAWPDSTIVQRSAAQIPWRHHQVLLDKLDNPDTRLWYAEKALQHGWSRDVLVHQIEGQLHRRQGQALTNFESTLPSPDSDLAQQLTKRAYLFPWLNLHEEQEERALERSLVRRVEDFLLEMGEGFALVSRQRHLEVGGDDFYIDLLLYQLRLRCYVVIELKVGKFKPEYAGKLGFYLNAVDDLIRTEEAGPTIGLVLCKSTNDAVVEYTLRNHQSPMQVSEYRSQPLPEPFRDQLPTTDRIAEKLKQLPMSL